MKHVVIMPARDEADYIAGALATLLRQTRQPERIVVVDDGSTDGTADVVRSFAADHPAVTLVPGPGGRSRRYRVVEVFDAGYASIWQEDFDFISKLDADLLFPPDYFEALDRAFAADPALAVAGGTIYENMRGRAVALRTPENHVLGMVKTYRRRVFDEMGGFLAVLGWDVIDLVKVRTLGYRSAVLAELPVLHRRRHASAGGILRGNMRMGRGAYIIGSHPLFALARSAYRMLEPPYVLGGLALAAGYAGAWMRDEPRLDDPDLVHALREEQLYRLFHRNRLPPARAAAPAAAHR